MCIGPELLSGSTEGRNGPETLIFGVSDTSIFSGHPQWLGHVRKRASEPTFSMSIPVNILGVFVTCRDRRRRNATWPMVFLTKKLMADGTSA